MRALAKQRLLCYAVIMVMTMVATGGATPCSCARMCSAQVRGRDREALGSCVFMEHGDLGVLCRVKMPKGAVQAGSGVFGSMGLGHVCVRDRVALCAVATVGGLRRRGGAGLRAGA